MGEALCFDCIYLKLAGPLHVRFSHHSCGEEPDGLLDSTPAVAAAADTWQLSRSGRIYKRVFLFCNIQIYAHQPSTIAGQCGPS